MHLIPIYKLVFLFLTKCTFSAEMMCVIVTDLTFGLSEVQFEATKFPAVFVFQWTLKKWSACLFSS